MARDGRSGPLMLLRGLEPRAGVEVSDVELPPRASTETGYVLDGVAARGFRPPRLLSSWSAVSEDDVERDVPEQLRATWTLLYRQLAETAPAIQTPYAIYLLGVNPPDGLNPAELTEFSDFYTEVHLPEVAERRNALRAVRYELVREVKRPYPTTPRYLAMYEMDEAAAANRRHVGPKYSAGPDVWQRHTTPWRLWYLLRTPTG